MSTVSLTEPGVVVIPPPPSLQTRRGKIIINDQIAIPGWVDDLASYRRWINSGEFPEQGRIAFLHGEVWVDLSMEELFSHNLVRAAFTYWFLTLQQAGQGRFIIDRMILTNEAADLSTEPDGVFFFLSSYQAGRIKAVESAEGTCLELTGTPDLVLEIISKSSVRKDSVVLKDLYWRAGIAEYWLVDVRKSQNRFDIFAHKPSGYELSQNQDGWSTSTLLGKQFKLERGSDVTGLPFFNVLSRDIG